MLPCQPRATELGGLTPDSCLKVASPLSLDPIYFPLLLCSKRNPLEASAIQGWFSQKLSPAETSATSSYRCIFFRWPSQILMTVESVIEKEDFNRRHLPANGSVFLTHYGLQSFVFKEKRCASGTRDWCLWQIQTVKRLGKMNEERSCDSELSLIAECSPEGSEQQKMSSSLLLGEMQPS